MAQDSTTVTADRPFLTTEQLAGELELSPITIMKWRAAGEGPAFIKAGRRVRYQRSDVNAWLDQQRRGGGAK